ncbi:hypothetical protein CEJ58_20185, partial [Acinetobacter baumannii]
DPTTHHIVQHVADVPTWSCRQPPVVAQHHVGLRWPAWEEVRSVDPGAGCGQDDAAFDQVFQLTHVAGPRVASHGVQRTVRQADRMFAVLRGKA